MKYIFFLISCLFYTVILLLVYLIHVNYFKVQVVLYSAILDGLIAAIISLGFFILFKKFSPRFQAFEISLIFCIWILGGYAFAITIPTVIDRSLSFFILEKIEARGGVVHKEEIEDIFLEYIPEVRLVDVRLTEQLKSKTISEKGNCVILTKRGVLMVNFSRFFRQNLLAKIRLLDGEYTDYLTQESPTSNNRTDKNC